jgi:anti-sigma regulatory factor (Ser/Thr protein kinase)
MEGKPAARWFQRTYSAEPAQVGWARRALTQALGDHPFIDDATLIASEFVTNAVLHSASRNGGKFTLRAEIHPGYVWIEVEDAGGPWNPAQHSDGRPHGFDVIEAIAGTGNWGIDGDAARRVAWAALGMTAGRDGSRLPVR